MVISIEVLDFYVIFFGNIYIFVKIFIIKMNIDVYFVLFFFLFQVKFLQASRK